MRYVKVLLLVLFFFLSMLFFIQNKDTVTQTFELVLAVPFLFNFRSIPLPFYLIVLSSFVVGGVLCIAYFLAERLRQSRQVKELRNRIVGLERELNQLRTMPLNQSRDDLGRDNPGGLQASEDQGN